MHCILLRERTIKGTIIKGTIKDMHSILLRKAGARWYFRLLWRPKQQKPTQYQNAIGQSVVGVRPCLLFSHAHVLTIKEGIKGRTSSLCISSSLNLAVVRIRRIHRASRWDLLSGQAAPGSGLVFGFESPQD